jgi:very-short-patch-repair endonuclease
VELRAACLLQCAQIAERQYGLIARAQVIDVGLSRFAVHRLIASKTWERVHPKVYRLWPASTDDQRWTQRMMAAALWLGDPSGASHRAAAIIWELDGVGTALIELTTARRHRSTQPGLVIHHVRSLRREDFVRRKGIPVTSIERTIVDLASVVQPAVLELALESALRRGLTTEDRIRRQIARSARTGKGKAVLKDLLGARARATDSALETLVWRALLEGGLSPPERQYTVVGRGGEFLARVDLAYVDAQVAIEADGYDFHSKPDDWRRDRRRQNALTRIGWIVYRVTWDDMTRRRRAVVEEIAQLLLARSPSHSSRSLEG